MKYTGITIGPIISSLALARKTRELWAASFFFSHLMRKIKRNLLEAGVEEENIILPYPHKNKLAQELGLTNSKTTGLYPDRLILQSYSGLYDNMQTAADNAIEELSTQFGIDREYLEKYLSIRIVEIDESDLKGENVIFKMNSIMACLELEEPYISGKDGLEFIAMLENINTKEIYTDKFKDRGGFPSIIEISTRMLKFTEEMANDILQIKKESNSDEDKLWEKLLLIEKDEKKKCDNSQDPLDKTEYRCYTKLKLSNKYIAIVQADGDNIGKLIEAIYNYDDSCNHNESLISEFSKALSRFSLHAADTIAKWGGEAIYAGGDDLLFFAPIENRDHKVFINLIQEIDDLFNRYILENSKLKECLKSVNKKPSMSYGVSISYYKFPMHEAIRKAQELLFGVAKQTKNKNAIAFQLLKHSGQAYSSLLYKGSNWYGKDLVDFISKSDSLQLHSLIYNLRRDEFILKEIIDDKTRIDNYFRNFYNERHHTTPEIKETIERFKNILLLINRESKDFEDTIEQISATMQLVKFINTQTHN